MATQAVWTAAEGEAAGRLVTEAEALVPLADRGFAYGDGLFETVRVWDGAVPLLSRHLARLARSIRLLGGPDLSAVRAALVEGCRQVVAANGLESGFLRITWSRGTGPRGFAVPAVSQWRLFVQGGPYTPRPADAPGLTAALAPWRVDPNHPACRVKSLSALDKVIAKTEATRLGVDELLFLNTAGALTEATAANLFVVTGGRLLTPAVECGLLPGVARGLLLDLAADLGVAAAEAVLPLQALADAEEVFLCNALMGVAPLVAVDGRPVGRQNGPGPVTRRLAGRYAQAMSGGAPAELDDGGVLR